VRQENLKYFALKNLGQEPRDGEVRQERDKMQENCLTPVRISPPGETLCETPQKTCPYTLPAGVTLRSFTPQKGPVTITVCSVVVDVPKFIRHALAELDARLHNPIQIRAGDSAFHLLSKLADCGLELKLEWPESNTGEGGKEI
jgi:hypothetical protein